MAPYVYARSAQGSLLKIIPVQEGPSLDPPTSSPFDSPSIKRVPHDPPWIQLEIKINPVCACMCVRFPTLSRAFVIIEFRDMLIKSDRSSGAPHPATALRAFPSLSNRHLSLSLSLSLENRSYSRVLLHTVVTQPERTRARCLFDCERRTSLFTLVDSLLGFIQYFALFLKLSFLSSVLCIFITSAYFYSTFF